MKILPNDINNILMYDSLMFVLSQFSNDMRDSISGFGYDGDMVDIYCENYMFSVSETEISIYTWHGIKNFPLCWEGIVCLIDHMIIGDRST